MSTLSVISMIIAPGPSPGRAMSRSKLAAASLSVVKLHGRNVDADLERRIERAPPAQRLRGGAAKHPVADLDDEPGLLGDRDEFARRHVAEFGMAPARQRLGLDDAAGADLDDRLIVELDLVVGERSVQIADEAGAGRRRDVKRGRKNLQAVAPRAFGGVHREVRVAQQRLDVRAVARIESYSQARRIEGLFAGERVGTRERRDDALQRNARRPRDRRRRAASR